MRPSARCPLDWDRDKSDWPHSAHSSFETIGQTRWHIQVIGTGPVALLLHGTGASTHSWRDCVPHLADSFTLVIPDLPGHGFSRAASERDMTLPAMARSLSKLVETKALRPDLVIGHSAGAAIALRMVLDGGMSPKAVVSLNGALLPFPGAASVMFPILAKILFLNPVSVPIAARLASDPDNVRRMIERTGTYLPPEALSFYARLLKDRTHVSAAINMMARWDLHALRRDLPAFKLPLMMVSGEKDLAVPAWVVDSVQRMVPHAQINIIPDCGHIAHEEQPNKVCRMVLDFAKEVGVLTGSQ